MEAPHFDMAKTMEGNAEYLAQLQAEKEHLDSTLFVHTERLLAQEIDRVQTGSCEIDGSKMADVCSDKPVKMSQKVIIPVKENPKFNFVGKLLGPKGNSLKRLQEDTGTKMSILGRGSMRDKKKEDECRKEGGKYAHLNEELHVLVEVYAPATEAFNRMGHSMNELRKYLVPDYNDEIRQQQLQEMWYLTGDEEYDNGVAGPPPPPPPAAGRGGAAPRGRGGVPPRGRPGAPAPRGRGGPISRPAPPGRGTHTPRGAPARGAGAYGASRLPKLEPLMDRGYDDGYGTGGYDEGYEQYGEAYAQGYSNGAGDTQFFDYGHGASARDSYEDGYGETYAPPPRNGMKAPPPRAANSYRAHPYTTGRTAGY